MSFFRNFRKVRNRKNSEFSVNSECLETPVFWTLTPKPSKTGFFHPKTGFFTQKQVFLTQKQEIISELISKLFLRNFCEFKKTRYCRKISKLWKPNYSETRKNKKFGKYHLMQGLRIFLSRKKLIKVQSNFFVRIKIDNFTNGYFANPLSSNWAKIVLNSKG